jgi:hypothetical protein
MPKNISRGTQEHRTRQQQEAVERSGADLSPSPQRVPGNEAEARQLVRWVLSRQR